MVMRLIVTEKDATIRDIELYADDVETDRQTGIAHQHLFEFTVFGNADLLAQWREERQDWLTASLGGLEKWEAEHGLGQDDDV